MMYRNQRKFKSKIKVKDTQSMLIIFQIIKFKSVYKPKSHLCLILPQGKIFIKQIEIILTALLITKEMKLIKKDLTRRNQQT